MTHAFNDASSAIEQAASIPGLASSSFDPHALRQALTTTGTALTQAKRAGATPALLNTAKTAALSAALLAAPHIKSLKRALLQAEAVPVPPAQMQQALDLKKDIARQLNGLKPKKREAAVQSMLSTAIADKDQLTLGVLTNLMAPSYPSLKLDYHQVLHSYVQGVVNQEQQALAKVGSLPGAIPYSSTLRNRRAITDVVLSGTADTFKKLARAELDTITPQEVESR